jgi:hypothetical protein
MYTDIYKKHPPPPRSVYGERKVVYVHHKVTWAEMK